MSASLSVSAELQKPKSASYPYMYKGLCSRGIYYETLEAGPKKREATGSCLILVWAYRNPVPPSFFPRKGFLPNR